MISGGGPRYFHHTFASARFDAFKQRNIYIIPLEYFFEDAFCISQSAIAPGFGYCARHPFYAGAIALRIAKADMILRYIFQRRKGFMFVKGMHKLLRAVCFGQIFDDLACDGFSVVAAAFFSDGDDCFRIIMRFKKIAGISGPFILFINTGGF
ncbi:MAG: hypothetical protein IKJ51_00575 [Clostridia bacterium]|nr:hypothetical protein [Clostridia bacterium]